MVRFGSLARVLWLLAGWSATIVWAQPVPFPNAENRNEFELSEHVQLDRADAATKKALEQVRAYLASKQWTESVNALIQLMETSGGKLFPVTERRFISVRDYCHLQFTSLPAEALAIYRSRVDSQAHKDYEEGIARRDSRRLLQVVRQAFASSWADNALYALGEISLESGDYAAARGYWEKIIPVESPAGTPRTWLSVPQTDVDLAAVRARLVLASILEGSLDRAREEWSRLARLHPDARGRMGGKDVRFVEVLQTLLAEAANWPAPPANPDWLTFAGSPQRNKTAPRSVDVGEIAWRASLGPAPAGKPLLGELRQTRRVADDAKTPLSYHPVAVGEWVLVNNQTEVRAWNVRTGEAAWGHDTPTIFRDQFDPSIHALYNPPETLGLPRFTATVHQDRLYARMGAAASGRIQEDREPARMPGYVVCLDLKAEGRLCWKITPEEGWSFEGTPVADDTHVYLAMRQLDIQPQLYVGCFDAQTGQRQWRQFICAAESPGRGMLRETSNNLLTLHGETLYYNTNLGAVAALATSDGRLLWLTLYPRVLRGHRLRPDPHWDRDLVPCLLDRGTLLVAPADSRRVLGIEAATGQILWQTGQELEDVVHLLGVAGDQLIASGHRLYWISLRGPEAGRVSHAWPDGPDRLGYGRGVLGGDCVWWPTRDKINVFDSRSRQLKREIQLAPRGVTGGNLLIAGERLLIATGTELVAFRQQGRPTDRGPPPGAHRPAPLARN